MAQKIPLLLIVIALLILVTPSVKALDLPEYTDLGTASAGEIVPYSIFVRNDNEKPLKVKITSACECVTVTAGDVIIPGNGSMEVTGFFDSTDYSGQTDKILIIEYTDQQGGQHRDFTVMGLNILVEEADSGDAGKVEIECTTCSEIEHLLQKERAKKAALAKLGQNSDLNGKLDDRVITASIFYSAGCRECDEFIREFIPEIERDYSIRVDLQEINIMEKSGFEQMSQELDDRGVNEVVEMPVLIVGRMIFQGFSEIEDGLLSAAKGELISEEGLSSKRKSDSDSAAGTFFKAAAPIPVFLAGQWY